MDGEGIEPENWHDATVFIDLCYEVHGVRSKIAYRVQPDLHVGQTLFSIPSQMKRPMCL